MKIIVLYGVGEVGKRNEALKIRKQFSPDNTTQIDLKGAPLRELEMQLASPSLFITDSRLIVVENVPDSLDLQKISGDSGLTLLIVANSPKAESTLLQSAKKSAAKLLLFEGEKELTAFPFLDALIEKKKVSFMELHKLMSEYGGIYTLTMVYYLLRRNLLPLPSSDFMRKKILSQKEKYSPQDWINLYRQTLETEFKIKSGLMTEDFGLDFLTEKFTGVTRGV